ncbi:MAG: DUF1257 domain-containing protein [Armatimonadetes bacterium]|nr:DUF1257 domain-containing protein [Armatimonadota bacterium]
MSHFTRIKTQMVEKEPLMRALRDLGYAPEEGAVTVRGWGGRRAGVEIRVPTGRLGYDIGFRKVGGAYECVADWWGVRGIRQDRFLQQVTQRYAYHAAREKLEAQGFTLAAEETTADGRIHLVLRRMA